MPPRTQPLIEREILEEMYFSQGCSLQKIADVTGSNVRLVRDSFTHCGLKWRSRSEALLGIVRSPETRAKISRARRGTKDRPEVAARKRQHLKTVAGWSAGLTKHTDSRVATLAAAFAKVIRTPEAREAMSKRTAERIRATGGGWWKGYHVSPKAGRVYYMSSWELARFNQLDADDTVLLYKPQPCSIPYKWGGFVKHYTPDVLVIYDNQLPVLDEIKPRQRIENDKTGIIAAKFKAAREFAAQRGWPFRVIDQKPEG